MQIKRFSEYADYSINEDTTEIKKDWESIQNKVLGDLNLNFHMTAVFGFGIGFFYPIVDSLVRNGVHNINVTDDMIVMITICIFAIIFKEKKPEIQKLIEELRLRGSFGIMKKVFNCVKFIKDLLSIIFKSCGMIIDKLSDIFNYTMIFVPCLTMLAEVIKTKSLDITSFGDCFSTIGFGLVTITAKHILTTYISKLKDKLKNLNINSFLNFFKVKSDKVKTFSDFKQEDLINDADKDLTSEDEIQYPEDDYEFEDEFADDYEDEEDSDNILKKFDR